MKSPLNHFSNCAKMQRGCKKGEGGNRTRSQFAIHSRHSGELRRCAIVAGIALPPLFPPPSSVWCYSPCNGCRRRRAERGDSSFFRGEAEQWWKQNHGIQRTKRKGPPHSQTIILQNFFVACEDLHSAERTGRFFPPPPYLHFQIPFVTANCPQAAEGGRKGEKKEA